MVDSAYYGKTFNVTLSDGPERKTDFVAGCYELIAPKGKTTVAVKMIDMLGEEVLVCPYCLTRLVLSPLHQAVSMRN